MTYFVVTYRGHIGYIKPWFSVRDSKSYSQQFLTPSIVEGMRQKLEVGAILRHKLTYDGFNVQQEQIQPRGWLCQSKQKKMLRPLAILSRGVLLHPELTLAFSSAEDAVRAACQHICLCRNEDLLLPEAEVAEMTEAEFDALPGYELRFGRGEKSFPVGFDRFNDRAPMYGWLEMTGDPVRNYADR